MPPAIGLLGPEIVVTRDAYPFQAVLDTFANAKRIRVVTYTVARGDQPLLRRLREARCPVRLIANLPSRFDGHRVPDARGRARRMIDRYLRDVSPASFGPAGEVYFHFANHARIILTDQVGFVGSANFAGESEWNWEAGVLVRSPADLLRLEQAVDKIAQDSVRYHGPRMNPALVPLLAAREELRAAIRRVTEEPSAEAAEGVVVAFNGLQAIVREFGGEWSGLGLQHGQRPPVVGTGLLWRSRLALEGLRWNLSLLARTLAGELDTDGPPAAGGGGSNGNVPGPAVDVLESQIDGGVSGVRAAVRALCRQLEETCRRVSESVPPSENPQRRRPVGKKPVLTETGDTETG